MARKKQHAKKTTHRRRRSHSVGALKMGGSILKDAALATAGYIGATFVAKMIPGDNNLLKAGAKLAMAVGTAKFIKGDTGKALAIGMGVSGVVDVAKQYMPNLISGIGEESTVLISGIGDIQTLGNLDALGDPDNLGDIDGIGDDGMGDIQTLGGLDD